MLLPACGFQLSYTPGCDAADWLPNDAMAASLASRTGRSE
jgi:hypothetical protein